jgi:hypothetical protein
MARLPAEIHGARPILFAELSDEAQVRGPEVRSIHVPPSLTTDQYLELLDLPPKELAARPGVTVTTLPPSSILVIGEALGEEGGYYLLSCDESFERVGDTHHDTLAEAKHQAEYDYPGIVLDWREVP